MARLAGVGLPATSGSKGRLDLSHGISGVLAQQTLAATGFHRRRTSYDLGDEDLVRKLRDWIEGQLPDLKG
jgi:ribosomal protein S13